MSIKNNTTSLQSLLDKVNALPDASTGVELPELTNEGSASDLLSGKQLIDQEGNKITGTFSIDSELTAQDNLIAQIQAAVDSLPEAGSIEPALQDKVVTPTTSEQNVTADSGYDGLDTVTVNAIPSTYVQPTSTKSATTYTPTTIDQTIAAGTYCSGVQTIKGDANLIPSNIINGKSIFGVAGTAVTGGSNDTPDDFFALQISSDGVINYYPFKSGTTWMEYCDSYMVQMTTFNSNICPVFYYIDDDVSYVQCLSTDVFNTTYLNETISSDVIQNYESCVYTLGFYLY